MKRVLEWITTFKFLSILIILFLLILDSGCKKEKDEIEQAKIKRSQEVRDSLTGEIIFFNAFSFRKVLAKSGGIGTKIGGNGFTYVVPKWSLDGSKIAYIQIISDPYSATVSYLKIINNVGIDQNVWLLPQYNVRSITWSPDGLYTAILCDNNKILYVEINTGEITETQLSGIQTGLDYYTSLAWWPNGNKIAISKLYENSIWLLDAFDNDPQKDPDNLLVTTSLVGDEIEYMDWSHDGSKLVYSGGNYGKLFIVNFDGTDNREIILKGIYKDDNILGLSPCWALNNKQIVFTGIIDMTWTSISPGLFVTDIDGSYLVDINIPGTLPDWY